MSATLVLKGVSKRYPGHVAVDDLSLEVEAGEFVTLLGPSGSGKTSTLMMVAGFTEPSAGEIHIAGKPVTRLPPEKRDLGVVFQSYALFPHMTVEENVAFPLQMRRRPRAEIGPRVAAALDLVRLAGLGGRLPRQLSGGQQQRVALARALVFEPRLLLMDEPLGALDKNLREQMQAELIRLHETLGITVVYVTHDQGEALTMSDRIALMSDGRIEQIGRAEDLYERPANRFVAEFLGESNVLEGAMLDGAFRTTEGFAVPVSAGAPGGALLVVRPEKVTVAPVAGEGLPGTVETVTYAGDVTRYRVRLAGGPVVTAKQQNRSDGFKASPGEAVRVRWHPDDGRLLPADR